MRDAARSWRCWQCWYGDVRHASSGCELCIKYRETLLNIFLWLYLVRQILAHLNYSSWEKGHWHIVAPFHCFCTTRFNLVMSTVISIKLWSICQSFLFKLQSNCYRPWCRNHGSSCEWWSQAWGSRGLHQCGFCFIETQCNIDVTLFPWLSCWLCHFLCYYAAVSLLETSVYPLWSSLSVSRNMRHSLLWEPPMVHLILSSSSMSASWERCTIITSSMMRDVVMLTMMEKMNGSVSNLIEYGRNWRPRTQRTRRISADSTLAFGLRVACVLYEFLAFGVSHFSLHKV